MNSSTSALLTDLVGELTMAQAYLEQKRWTNWRSSSSLSVSCPPHRNFLLAAGLEQVLDYLSELKVTQEELAWLDQSKRFRSRLLRFLESFRFTGDVEAMPEGTTFFPHEPILRIVAPLPQAQLVESRVMNLLNFQTMVASKAARSVLVSDGKPLIDFGLRRAHGAEAGLLAARASYLAGFSGTATVLAGMAYGIPFVWHHGPFVRASSPGRSPGLQHVAWPNQKTSSSSSTPTTRKLPRAKSCRWPNR
ncbi:MAG: hypothetical protein U0236_14815 [Nitrospira sp.]